jgi:hypothetical protein
MTDRRQRRFRLFYRRNRGRGGFGARGAEESSHARRDRCLLTYSTMPINRLLCLLILSILVTGAPLGAAVIFSNLAGNCCGGYAVYGSQAPGGYDAVAAAFTPGASFLMTDAQVEVFNPFPSGPYDPFFNISLYSDGGNFPENLIGMFGVDITAPTSGGLVTASGTPEQLQAGVRYWLVLTAFDANTAVGWEMGGNSFVPFTGTATLGTWPRFPSSADIQFQIDSAAEPASLSLVAVALTLAVIARAVGARSSRSVGSDWRCASSEDKSPDRI